MEARERLEELASVQQQHHGARDIGQVAPRVATPGEFGRYTDLTAWFRRARRGVPKQTADLEQHCIIGFDRHNEFIRGVVKPFGRLRRSLFTLRTDSDVAQLALIRAGAGIGACQAPLARRDPQLVRVLANRCASPSTRGSPCMRICAACLPAAQFLTRWCRA